MKNKISKLLLPLIGLGALIWFLIRVIPKPSRASYPCQRAAFPIASGFIIYLASLASAVFALNSAKKYLRTKRYWVSLIFIIGTVITGSVVFQGDRQFLIAKYQNALEEPNQSVGTGKGIFPGRVVWIRDSAAVDQQCSNSSGDYWWMDTNTDQTVVNDMVSKALKSLTGEGSDAEAWDAIFRYYNQTHARGEKGYTSGEKIVIKINLNNGPSGGNQADRSDNRIIDTSPQIVFAVLDQLINVAGVAQPDIGFGDPGRNVDNIFWDKFHSIFPDVNYWGIDNGRTPIVQSASPELYPSDGGVENHLPACYLEATYMINIPVFKQHHRAGISLTSKNHFGTFVPFLGNAFPLHYSLPCTEGDGNVNNGEYNQYRIFVDFIGHKDLGGKTILYLIDGLWSSTNYGDPPWKWRTAPFNNSYPASIFASQDPVAVESVGFDFLFNEFYVGNPSGNDFPHYSGVDDFLHQAADSVNWPQDILYDPEADGSYLPRSMGVHEHWNNPADKKYSKNLGSGNGIELVTEPLTSIEGNKYDDGPAEFYLENNFPNPFNPSTTIKYTVSEPADLDLSIYNCQGKHLKTLVHGFHSAGTYKVVWDGRIKSLTASSGVYLAKLEVEKSGNLVTQIRKMMLIK
ncbi:MAG TPA: DUF362 domain-containing protein [Ignavibacteriaceae bacterium]|nr:DUF362 domain-containing protein [Ignavibacteriaceae bacterium]